MTGRIEGGTGTRLVIGGIGQSRRQRPGRKLNMERPRWCCTSIEFRDLEKLIRRTGSTLHADGASQFGHCNPAPQFLQASALRFSVLFTDARALVHVKFNLEP